MKISYILNFDEPKADLEKLFYEKFCIDNAQHFANVIKDYDYHLRNIIKYNDAKYTEQEINIIQSLRDTLHNLLQDSEYSFYDFI